jgi:hypothetical protein
MNEPTITTIDVGKYKFQIIDNTSISSEGIIYSRNFKIGGKHADCVNVSINYSENIPISAYIPHAMYDEECTLNIPLERGGSVIMIKTLLNYIHKQIPTITEVELEDRSNIECATENEIITKGSRFRKRGTNVTPIPLYYFSIAFNGKTWYEKYFDARLKDTNKYEVYREKVNQLLYSQELKTNTPFIRFLELAQPPKQVADKLEKYYNESDTFGNFFQSIPISDRCNLVRDWIYKFMTYHLKDVFSNTDWIIELPLSLPISKSVITTEPTEIDTPLNILNGTPVGVPLDVSSATLPEDVGNEVETSLRNSPVLRTYEFSSNQLKSTDIKDGRSGKKGGNKRKTRKYYCPVGRIRHYTAGYGLGVDAGHL